MTQKASPYAPVWWFIIASTLLIIIAKLIEWYA